MSEAILSARCFCYRYPGAASRALEGISLEIEPGSFTILVGETGSGKSTLLKAACGLVPHFSGGELSGEFSVGGMSLREHGPGELARICGTVFQDPEAQIVMSGVRAEVSLPLEQRGAAPAALARAVEETALVLGIAHLLDRPVETLSGGELQRVALAAALAHRPALLVLDEPTSQLDPVAGDELVWLLRRLNEEWGTTVLMAEHRLERCLGAVDRVVALEGGVIVSDENPAGHLAWAARSSPTLATPAGRMFSLAGLTPLPPSVKRAREQLRTAGLLPDASAAVANVSDKRLGAEVVRVDRVWVELPDGPAILRGIDFVVARGECVVLMGRNGAGKSTLLRAIKGLTRPTRGRVRCDGAIALLMQNPGDYLIHERVADELDAAGIAAAWLSQRAQSNPRDLSGGERQRLALEIVLGESAPVLACLDEPTRGMDRGHKVALARRLEALAGCGSAVLVATHDTEFAAEFADRVVLMGEGVLIADGAVEEILAGGWHFATEVARVLGGAAGALTAEQGAAVLSRELVG